MERREEREGRGTRGIRGGGGGGHYWAVSHSIMNVELGMYSCMHIRGLYIKVPDHSISLDTH